MSKPLKENGLKNFDALKRGLQLAAKNKQTAVLQEIPKLLGNLLNAAISDGDICTAQYFIEAGAEATYGRDYFNHPRDAFAYYAALSYFDMLSPNVPSMADVMKSYLSKISSCDCCDFYTRHSPIVHDSQFDSDLQLFDSHVGRYVDSPLLIAVQKQDIKAIHLLLDNNALITLDCGNYHGQSHTTPFTLAVSMAFADGVSIFLQRGININTDVSSRIIEDCPEDILKTFLRFGLHHNKISHNSDLAIAAGKHRSAVPAEHQESAPLSLKFVCRQVLRESLINCRLENLFIHTTRPKLGLPQNLCEYLVCHFDISQ